MEYNEAHIEQFDAYLKQQMSAEEKVQFESKLRSDKDFQKAFDLYQLLVNGIQEKERSDLKTFLKANVPEMPRKPRWQVHKNVWSIAASIALIIGLIILFQYNPKQPEQLAIQPASDELLTGLSDTSNQKPNLATIPSNKTLADKQTTIPVIIEPELAMTEQYDDVAPNSKSLTAKDEQWEMDPDKYDVVPRYDAYQSGTPNTFTLKDTQISILYVYDEVVKDNDNNLKRSKALSKQSTQTSASSKAAETVEVENKSSKLEKIYLKVVRNEDEFEGYTFHQSYLTLYQNQLNSYKLFNYLNKWYLSIGNDVYQIQNHCIGFCSLEKIKDTQIINLFLNNKWS